MNRWRFTSLPFLATSLCAALTMSCAKRPPAPAPEAPLIRAPTVERTTLHVDGTDLSLHLPSNTSAPLPAVLMFHSALGLTDAVRSYADALAERGFAVCVLDFYDGRVASSVEAARELRDEANARLPALTTLVERAYDELRIDPRVQADRRYLLGWSYGGAWATYAAGFLESVSGVVAISGEAFSGDETLLDRYAVPLLMVGAANDTEPTPERLDEIRDAIVERGGTASVLVVDAEHGFMEPSHPGYAEPSANQAWSAIVEALLAWEPEYRRAG